MLRNQQKIPNSPHGLSIKAALGNRNLIYNPNWRSSSREQEFYCCKHYFYLVSNKNFSLFMSRTRCYSWLLTKSWIKTISITKSHSILRVKSRMWVNNTQRNMIIVQEKCEVEGSITPSSSNKNWHILNRKPHKIIF